MNISHVKTTHPKARPTQSNFSGALRAHLITIHITYSIISISKQNPRRPMPSQARSLLQGSPFPREGTEVPSPRWEVSSETSLPRERRAVQGPSLPGGEHVYNMLPLRDGGWELRLPSLYPQNPYPQSPFSTGQFTWLYTCAYSLSGGLYGIQHSRLLNA